MCRQTLGEPASGEPQLALSPHPRSVVRLLVTVRILHSVRVVQLGFLRGVEEFRCRSWATANSPFWSAHVAAWYRSGLERRTIAVNATFRCRGCCCERAIC